MLANPFNWRVRWPRPARVPLFSLGLRYLEVHVATAGGWLTRYRPREVRNSIYRYRKIHIDYRSKYLYRFISPISIIYGNTNCNVVSHWLGAYTEWSLIYNHAYQLSIPHGYWWCKDQIEWIFTCQRVNAKARQVQCIICGRAWLITLPDSQG